VDLESALILAECKDHLGQHETAESLYRTVLSQEPGNALAHSGLGLMLLGTGNRNFGAVNACGLNQEEALGHLRMALEARGDLEPAAKVLIYTII
jgi:tetratricopeptide (TPR) repeat protein